MLYLNGELAGNRLVIANIVARMTSVRRLFGRQFGILINIFWFLIEDAIRPCRATSKIVQSISKTEINSGNFDIKIHFMSYSDVPLSNLNVGGKAGVRSTSSVKARSCCRTSDS